MKKQFLRFIIMTGFLGFWSIACMVNPLDLMHREIGPALDPLIPQLVKSNKSEKKLTLAVAGFKEIQSGRPLNISAVIEEELATRLVNVPCFTIVEHRKVSEIEDEWVKQHDMIYDENTTREVGKLVGADAILSGTIDDHGSEATLYARIIDIEKGFVLATATVKISKLGLPAEAWKPRNAPVSVSTADPEDTNPLPENLTFGITPYLNPKKLEETFNPILAYLEQETGIRMRMVVVSDYGKLAERMKTGEIDIGVFSPFAYVDGFKNAGVKIFASQRINGRSTYQGLIIAKKGRGIKALSDLKNRTFAFVDPKSTSGYIYPRAMLIENGYNPAVFFRDTLFAGSHDNALRIVLNGRCDAGAVFEDALDDKTLASLCIVARTEKIPYDAYTVRQDIPRHVVDLLQRKLISLDRNTSLNGKPVLSGSLDGFVIARDATYDTVRKMASFRADRPNLAVMNFREIGGSDEPLAETGCELFKSGLLAKNKFNIMTASESPSVRFLNASNNPEDISESVMTDLAAENIQYILSGSVIHLGERVNVSIKLIKIPEGTIESAFTRSGAPQTLETMITSLTREIDDATPVSGYVITVDGNTFITDFGADNGIGVGDRIIVYQNGRPLVNPLTGAPLGRKEDILAIGTVISTTPKVAVCRITSGKTGNVRFGKYTRTLRKKENPVF
jgi:phosphate/phosphite/phosphonate ABC transporter binding protein